MRNPITDMRLAISFLEDGIVPMARVLPNHATATAVPCYFDINKVLASMPPEEAQVMRRKFRKLWRKAAAAMEKRNGRDARRSLKELGFHNETPKKSQKNARKVLVFTAAWKKVNSELRPVQSPTTG